MAFTPFNARQVRNLQIHYNGSTAPDPAKFRLILCNSSDFDRSSTMAAILKRELLISASPGYARQQYNPADAAWDGANQRAALPQLTLTFSATTSGYQYDAIVLLADAHAKANQTVESIASNTITQTAHGLSDGDKVLFTSTGTLDAGMTADTIYFVRDSTTDVYKIAATLGGAAIALGGSWTGTMSCRYANGEPEIFELQSPAATIPAGGSYDAIINLVQYSKGYVSGN